MFLAAYGMGYYYFDPTYILIVIAALLSLVASGLVQSTFSKYSRYMSASGMTGAQAAQRILNNAGIYDVSVQHISGNLTDHYDPSSKTLRLSDTVYGSRSVAAVGVAAHECGHAIQHAKNYAPLSIRGSLVPVANLGSTLSWPMILIGVFAGWNQVLIEIGILLFCAAVLFQLVTLPVEINASRRALKRLEEDGILGEEELGMTKKVLGAAALTYVAAAAGAVLQLLRLIILFGDRKDD